jgi:hypothetical protein
MRLQTIVLAIVGTMLGTLGLGAAIAAAPAAAQSEDTIGVHRGDRFLLRNSNTGGPADLEFPYGATTDEPLVGDWNSDRVDTIGVRRGKRFLLRNSNTGGPADLEFFYGATTDEPLVGDWNGDRVDTIGVRRGKRFLLRNSNTGGPADLDFLYGSSTDGPLTGSWRPPDPVVVATFTTPLVPGQPRNTNIHLAADYIDGDVIPAGSSYSLNQGIGPRTTSRGFVGNGFIDGDGDVISVIGGGVSQMGTTFLNAAWFAGIELVDFRQHSLYFERYPMCREATLSWGTLDVVVVNDTPFDLTIATDHSAESVTVNLIGTPWYEVDSWIGEPYGQVGDAFTVDCGRTVTSPDGSTTSDAYTWRYEG